MYLPKHRIPDKQIGYVCKKLFERFLWQAAVKCLKIYCFLLLITVAGTQPVLGQLQSDNYELFTTKSGLPNDIVLSIAQDDRGLLWIGTNNGLCIYDGHTFQKVKGLFDENNLWQNDFRVVFKDFSGNIWCCAQSGHLGIYEVKKHRWKKFFLPVETGKFVTNIFEDIHNRIYIRYCNDNNVYQLVQNGKKLQKTQITAPLKVMSGNSSIPLNFTPGHPYLFAPQLVDTVFYNNNHLHEKEIISQSHFAYHVGASGTLLLASAGLIKKYDKEGNLKDRIVISDQLNIGTDEIVYAIFEDASGILWLGTDFGLLKIDRRKYQFLKYTNNSISRTLNRNYVRSIFADSKDRVWVGYKAGVLTMFTFDSYSKRAKPDTFAFPDRSPGLFTTNVIRQLRSGTMLIGGWYGLFAARIANGKGAFKILDPKDENGKSVLIIDAWSILEDKKGRLWVGTRNNGLYILKTLSKVSKHYSGFDSGKYGTSKTSVWNLLEDREGSIWLATEDGLYKAIPDVHGEGFRFEAIHSCYTGAAGRKVWSLTEDKYGHLWMGTTDGGFSMLDTVNRRFITYNQTNGFANNICGILNDPKGYLWISTPGGIIKFDVLKHTVLRFSEADGLISNNFNFNACARSPSGTLFWGTKSGMTSFHPDSIQERAYRQVPVVIRAVWLGDKVFIDDPGTGQHIVLKHNQNFFSIHFALPEFSAPAMHRFAYRLKGIDKDWVLTNTYPPHASYTNVPPGDYTFQVKGSADGIHWNNETTQLAVTIKPAFWQHILFRIGLVLLLLFVAIIIGYRYLQRQKEKHRMNQQVAELELKALQAQMNPHFIFNSLNAIQHFILTNDVLVAYDYLSKFSRLIRLYLESSKSRYIDLAEEVELLKLYIELEKLRFGDVFNYCLDISPALENSSVEIPSMLLQPYVENAINHGLASGGRAKEGILNITFERVGDAVKCNIEDNGIGRERAAKIKAAKNPMQKSRGTELINERLDTLKKVDDVEIKISIIDKFDTKGNSSGTRIEIYIPLA